MSGWDDLFDQMSGGRPTISTPTHLTTNQQAKKKGNKKKPGGSYKPRDLSEEVFKIRFTHHLLSSKLCSQFIPQSSDASPAENVDEGPTIEEVD